MINCKVNRNFIFLSLSGLFVVLQSFWGVCFPDESFYLAEIKRLFDGQKMFLDNYMGTQYYTPIFLPLYSVFMKVFNDSTGIILFMRLFQVLFSYFVSLYLFFTLYNKTDKNFKISFLSFFAILCFQKGGIRGLSYYSFALYFILIGVLILYNMNDYSNYAVRSFISGVCFSLSVLCNPYLCFFYIAVFIPLFFIFFKNKKILRCMLWIILACCFSAFCYLLFIHKTSNIAEVFLSMKNHAASTVVSKKNSNQGFKRVFTFYKILRPYAYPGSIHVLSVIVLLFLAKKKINLSQRKKIILFLINFLILLINIFFINLGPGTFSIPLLSFAIVCCCFDNKILPYLKTNYAMFFLYPGLILGCAFFCASDTASGAALIGLVLTVPFSIYCIYSVLDNLAFILKINSFIKIVVFVSIFSLSFFSRILKYIADDQITDMNSIIKTGPAKGLITSKKHKEVYDLLQEDIKYINSISNKDSTLLISPMYSPGYISYIGKECSPASWSLMLDYPRLNSFFKTHEFPDYVYVIISEQEELKYYWGSDKDHYFSESDLKGKFYTDVILKSYKKIILNKGILYCKM